MNRLVVALVALAAVLAQPVHASEKVTIGLSLADVDERWAAERDTLTKLLTAQGFEVVVQVANFDPNLQNEQIRAMAAQGAKVIVVVPEDGTAAARAVEEVTAAGVKVSAYDRLVRTPKLAAYVSFDNVEVGRSQARGVLAARGSGNFVLLGGSPTDNNARQFRAGQLQVLTPLVQSGKIKIVSDRWVDYWDGPIAKKVMQEIIGSSGARIDAVVASNDGTALGALEAMRSAGLAGKVPISGQDASEQGCNSIARGELTVTVHKDTRKLVPLVATLAARLARGSGGYDLEPVRLADLTGDEALAGAVPCKFLPVELVTRANLKKLVVDSGYQTYEAVYRDVPDPPAR